MPGVPFLFQPHDFLSQGRRDIHKPTGKDQTSTLDHPTKTHRRRGEEMATTRVKNSPARDSSVRPPWCLSYTLFSFLPLFHSTEILHAGGNTVWQHPHPHSSRRRGQIVRDTLEPSRKPHCTRDKAGQKTKPVSHAEALGQLYKDSHSTHTHSPRAACRAVEWWWKNHNSPFRDEKFHSRPFFPL